MPEKDEKIANRFTVLEKLGEGNIGAVYKCYDPVMDNIVAIKLLVDQGDPTSASRFHREAKATAKLDHPNIVKIIDFGEQNGQLYIVLEFCPGKSLEDTNQGKRLPLAKAIEIFSQISKGMNYANQNKILHRDLKPSNIILVQEEKDNYIAKIVDFGLAKVKTDDQQLTGPGMAVGTPAYMSPEAAMGETLDSRSDIFSMGCLMFETLSGVLPFNSSNQLESLMNRVDNDAPSLNTIEEISIPANLTETVDKCLKRLPDQRIQSFSELANELEAVLISLNKTNKSEEKEETLPKVKISHSGKRTKIKFSAIVALIIIAVVVVALFPLLLLSTTNQIVSTPISKEDSVLPAVQYDDLIVQEKVVIEDGIKWISVWGASSSQDTEKLLNRKDIKNLKIVESHLASKESDFFKTLDLLRLNLKLSYVSDYCMKNVCTNKRLEYLRLDRSSGISVNGIRELLNCKNMKTLYLKKTESGDDFIPILSKLSNLEFLDLSHCKNLKGSNLYLLGKCKHLNVLKLVDNNISLQNFTNSKYALKVNSLYLDNCGIRDSDLIDLVKLNVKVLSLRRNELSLEGVQLIAKNKFLTRLLVDKPKHEPISKLKEIVSKFKNCRIEFSVPGYKSK